MEYIVTCRSSGWELTVNQTQLVDGETCGPGKDSGLPSIKVPIQHITDGIPETDMIVYLSLGFAISTYNSSATETNNSSTIYMNDTDAITNSSSDNEELEVNTDEFIEKEEEEDLMIYEKETDKNGFGGWIKDMVSGGGDRRTRRRRKLESSC